MAQTEVMTLSDVIKDLVDVLESEGNINVVIATTDDDETGTPVGGVEVNGDTVFLVPAE